MLPIAIQTEAHRVDGSEMKWQNRIMIQSEPRSRKNRQLVKVIRDLAVNWKRCVRIITIAVAVMIAWLVQVLVDVDVEHGDGGRVRGVARNSD